MNSFPINDIHLEFRAGRCCVFYHGEMIALTEFDDDGLIRWIWVGPRYRHQGLAKLMLREIERRTHHVARALPPVTAMAQPLFA